MQSQKTIKCIDKYFLNAYINGELAAHDMEFIATLIKEHDSIRNEVRWLRRVRKLFRMAYQETHCE